MWLSQIDWPQQDKYLKFLHSKTKQQQKQKQENLEKKGNLNKKQINI